MKICFACPICEHAAQVSLPGPGHWQCPGCDHVLELACAPEEGNSPLRACSICGNRELYKKKAFPHWLGLSILTGACVAFLALNAVRQYVWAWAFLLGSAAVDGILYLCVGDAVVCYRCGAHHSCASVGEAHPPFELIVAERYRQERIRREQLGAGKKSQ